MTRRKVLLGVMVLGTALAGGRPAAAANSVSGSAFGVSANLVVGSVAPTPNVVLPPDGGSTEAHEALLAVLNIISSGTLTTSSTGTVGPLIATATSKAAVEQVDILPSSLVSADAVITNVSCTGDGTTATCSAVGTTILGLRVNGVLLGNITPAPNTTITVPLVGSVILNEQINAGNGITTKSLLVNLIHVQLAGILGAGDIIVGQAQAGVDFSPAAVDPCDCPPPDNSVSGEAYGSKIDLGLLVVGKNPVATLSSEGGSASAGVPSVLIPSTLSSATESQTTSGTLTPTSASSQSQSSVEGANVLAGLVTADLLLATCSCTGNGTTASCTPATTFTNLVVDNVTIAIAVAPNTVIPILGLGSVILNEQVTSGNGTTSSALTINMVHVIVDGVGDIVVASAHCDVDLTLVDPTCNPCDDGDPCNGVEVCDPQQGCLPGAPPPTMCTTTSTSATSTTSTSSTSSTSSSTIAPPICGNGVVEAGEECDPPGSISCPAGSPAGAFLACGASCTCPAVPTTTSTTSPIPTTTSTTLPTPTTSTTTVTVTTSTVATTTTTTTTIPSQCGNGVVDGTEQCDTEGGPPCPTPQGFPQVACNVDCTCADPCPEFAFLVQIGGKFGNGVQVTGGIGANDPGALFGLGKGAFVSDGSTVAADHLRLGQGSSVFHVETNALQTQSSVLIRGGQEFATLPLVTPFCSIPEFSCGGTPVIVPPGGSVGPLAPGSYGPLIVYQGGVLVLQPGTYDFCSFRAGKNAAITLLGGTQTTIRVTGDFRLGNGSVLAPGAGTPIPRIDVAGRTFRVGARATLEAFTAAPNALLRVGRSGQIRGTACARTSKSDKGVVLSCPP